MIEHKYDADAYGISVYTRETDTHESSVSERRYHFYTYDDARCHYEYIRGIYENVIKTSHNLTASMDAAMGISHSVKVRLYREDVDFDGYDTTIAQETLSEYTAEFIL